MEFRELKQCVETIYMTDAMRNRIIRNCRLSAVQDKEEIHMKNRVSLHFRKTASIAAVIVLCLCASVAAANHYGMFKDIVNWHGAVVGTEYVGATDEIGVSVVAGEDGLTVTAALLLPDAVPYSTLEGFGIGSYQIVDGAGKLIAERKCADSVPIMDGKAVMTIPLDGVDHGDYRLLVTSFVGYRKGDQPLEMHGSWECKFSV